MTANEIDNSVTCGNLVHNNVESSNVESVDGVAVDSSGESRNGKSGDSVGESGDGVAEGGTSESVNVESGNGVGESVSGHGAGETSNEVSETNNDVGESNNEVAVAKWSRATFLAQQEMAKDSFDSAREHYIDALNAALQLRDTAPILYAQTQVAFAAVCLLTGDSETALFFLVEVQPIYRKYYAASHWRMLELYHLIANANHLCGLFEDAKQWYELTLKNLEHVGPDHPDKKVVLENYSALLGEQKAVA